MPPKRKHVESVGKHIDEPVPAVQSLTRRELKELVMHIAVVVAYEDCCDTRFYPLQDNEPDVNFPEKLIQLLTDFPGWLSHRAPFLNYLKNGEVEAVLMRANELSVVEVNRIRHAVSQLYIRRILSDAVTEKEVAPGARVRVSGSVAGVGEVIAWRADKNRWEVRLDGSTKPSDVEGDKLQVVGMKCPIAWREKYNAARRALLRPEMAAAALTANARLVEDETEVQSSKVRHTKTIQAFQNAVKKGVAGTGRHVAAASNSDKVLPTLRGHYTVEDLMNTLDPSVKQSLQEFDVSLTPPLHSITEDVEPYYPSSQSPQPLMVFLTKKVHQSSHHQPPLQTYRVLIYPGQIVDSKITEALHYIEENGHGDEGPVYRTVGHGR